MVMDAYLFVGGTNDGRRIAVPDRRPTYRLPKKLPPMLSIVCDFNPSRLRREEETYRRWDFTGDGQRLFHIYALHGLTPDDVFVALITKYPEEGANER
jgi:hypothetical protein